jgi:hypothetical protein
VGLAPLSQHHKMMGIKICDSLIVSQPSRNKSINKNPRHQFTRFGGRCSLVRAWCPGNLPRAFDEKVGGKMVDNED